MYPKSNQNAYIRVKFVGQQIFLSHAIELIDIDSGQITFLLRSNSGRLSDDPHSGVDRILLIPV